MQPLTPRVIAQHILRAQEAMRQIVYLELDAQQAGNAERCAELRDDYQDQQRQVAYWRRELFWIEVVPC